MTCPACGTDASPGQRFCGECGASLAAGCPRCGTANPPGQRFCGECGAQLSGAPDPIGASPATSVAGTPGPSTVAERRLVSVLFADLVGFTPFAEDRDAEEVRETLSRYFELAQDVVARYGGVIEKFIGDAVMAVWGTPTAHEDDAERAVRAALDLVDAVRRSVRGIDARAGVLTGEVAVTLGATNQGMVAGDIVNTASRIQSVAPPGTVLVGEATFQAASKRDRSLRGGGRAGAQGQGRAGPRLARAAGRRRAWRSRPVGRPRGAVRRARRGAAPAEGPLPRHRSRAPDAPRVGHGHRRDRQEPARLGVREVPRRPGRARLVAPRPFARLRPGRHVLGAGRDGPGPVRPGRDRRRGDHAGEARGRRSRRISPTRTSAAGSRRRCWRLLGIETPAVGREELFGGWRTFFERLAATAPVVMVFEDLHWADDGTLDFIDHLLDWAAGDTAHDHHARAARAPRAPARLGRRTSQLRRRRASSRCPSRRCASCSRASCRACRRPRRA